MSHTIYAAKFEQTIIHQHVHLRWESQSHAPAHVLNKGNNKIIELRTILQWDYTQSVNRSFVYKAKEWRHVRIRNINYNLYKTMTPLISMWAEMQITSLRREGLKYFFFTCTGVTKDLSCRVKWVHDSLRTALMIRFLRCWKVHGWVLFNNKAIPY